VGTHYAKMVISALAKIPICLLVAMSPIPLNSSVPELAAHSCETLKLLYIHPAGHCPEKTRITTSSVFSDMGHEYVIHNVAV
jgi:hypothetical protein